MKTFDSKTKTWSGPKVKRSETLVPFRELVLQSIRLKPDKVFQISDDEGTQLTFAEVETLSIRVFQNLQRFGVVGGDTVSMMLKNSTSTAPIVFGCFMLGAPVNPFFCKPGTELSWIKEVFSATKPKVVILEEFDGTFNLIKQAVHELELDSKIFLFGESGNLHCGNVFNACELLMSTGNEKNFKLPKNDGVDDESPVIIIPSSGTTGIPKAISIPGTYAKLIKFCWTKPENAVVFSYSTISWFSGLMALVYPLLNSQLRIITKAAFSPKHFGYIVKKYSITTTISSTENATAMLNSPDFVETDFVSMKEFYCGGERISKMVREYVKSKLPKGCYGSVYGATEVGAIMTSLGVDTDKIDDNVVGSPKENIEVRIADIETRQLLGPNENGEILVHSPSLFCGYQGKPELKAKTLETGNWYKTGDIGYFDENGLLHVHGRIIHMIRAGGRNVHPAEIEQVFESFVGVKAACALNITENKLLSVLIELTPDSTIDQEFLSLKAKERFKDAEFLGGIHIVREIPRTITMSRKINRTDAEELAMKLYKAKGNF